ncbi:hypothetical protein AMECASPLE_013631 [Ameca splendens]|uniref:Uncharacterized protein n=1 Tax=Ameca splendens TaxID=208324 RepID=A0ABV1A910_9TELE
MLIWLVSPGKPASSSSSSPSASSGHRERRTTLHGHRVTAHTPPPWSPNHSGPLAFIWETWKHRGINWKLRDRKQELKRASGDP